MLLIATASAHPVLAQVPRDAATSATAESSRTADASAPGKLVTDRPDFTESSEVAGDGVLVLESGFRFEGDSWQGKQSRSIATPSVLARIGIGPRAELRVSGDGFVTGWLVGHPGSATPGYSDLEVGAKVKLLDRRRFDVAMIPSVSIPTKDRHFSTQTYDPAVKLTWAAAVSPRTQVAGNLNLSRLWDGERRYNQHAVSVSLGRELNEAWGTYAEIYGLSAMEGPATATGWTANGGVTRAVGPHMQLDVEAGRGLTTAAPDWFAAFGFAVRHALFRR